MVHLDADLVISLDPGTMFVTIGSLIADSLITTGPTLSFVIIAVSFSVSTLLPLVFRIGGTPTTITDTLTRVGYR